jgi:hypothetical protein
MWNGIVEIVIGVIAIGIGSLISVAVGRLRTLYIYSVFDSIFRNDAALQIVLSSVRVAAFNFTKDGSELSHNSPPNVLFTPLPEGRGVASICEVVQKLSRRTVVKLVAPDHYDPTIPAIIIGGPSVNSLSAKILHQQLPDFKIDYPQATRASFRGTLEYVIKLDVNGNVIVDHGFILSTRNSRAPQIVVWGVLAFGTLMAIEKLITISRWSDAGRTFRTSKRCFIAISGNVDGQEIKESSIVASMAIH